MPAVPTTPLPLPGTSDPHHRPWTLDREADESLICRAWGDLPPTLVALLLLLGRCFNFQTGELYIGKESLGRKLAEVTGRSEPFTARHLHRLLCQLRDLGLLSWIKGHTGWANAYTLNTLPLTIARLRNAGERERASELEGRLVFCINRNTAERIEAIEVAELRPLNPEWFDQREQERGGRRWGAGSGDPVESFSPAHRAASAQAPCPPIIDDGWFFSLERERREERNKTLTKKGGHREETGGFFSVAALTAALRMPAARPPQRYDARTCAFVAVASGGMGDSRWP